jgi:ATP-dependent DNA helicase RecQ
LQREIIDATLAGKDVFALLPTGGGKSLCFQLPALHRTGLTVVVSPLIALMKDQVDQLQAAGVAATFINSSLDAAESRSRLAGLHRNQWRILYVSPERLLLDNWQENLKAWKVAAIAIDEAHCISEWGHDFRPEYRQLARLRELLPGIPLMALTATATERVRTDIVAMLQLKEPGIYVASFNRPNLSYRVLPKSEPAKQLLSFLKGREEEAGIIYCSTRATTERVAESLCARGLRAKAYHAGMNAEDRAETQDQFLRDDTRIVCATIAFGMGINKPNVRWVIHHDLPKNIAGYYQETGRAGRDGLPGDCLLLYSGGDIAKQSHFIEEITDEKERSIARTQLNLMAHYAESPSCRRAELLGYFGETFPLNNCGACDNCTEPRETYDATIQAQKFLSCVYRVRQASRFGCGMNHIVDVLMGAETEKIQRWGHDELSTYGIGADMNRPQWLGVGRELLRLGYVGQGAGEYPVLEITEQGMELLRARQQLELTKPMAAPKAKRMVRRVGEVECDEFLLGRLKTLRKRLADERRVPAYVIFGDATLRQLAREYPVAESGMDGVFGMGEKKRAEFGALFAAEIADFLKTNSRMRFD